MIGVEENHGVYEEGSLFVTKNHILAIARFIALIAPVAI